MRRTLLLWFAVAGAPLAWTVHLLAGYGYEEVVCSPGTARQNLWGLGVEPFVAVVTAAAAAVALAGGVAAWTTWRAARGGALADPRGRISFTSFAALLASVLFFLAIVLGGVQIVGLRQCAP